MEIFDLTARYDSLKSFYGKAKVLIFDNGTIQLLSYDTIVGEIRDGKYYQLWDG